MYDHIAGELVRKDLTEAVVRAGGVGYRLIIPVTTYEALPREGPVSLYTHLVVREDGFRLYGFATDEERVFFRILLTASGIGPAVALAIMSGASIQEFSRAVAEEDDEALSRVRGIGKKTARRIVAELKESIDAFRRKYLIAAGTPDTAVADAVLALESLGYPKAAAEKAARKAGREHPAADAELIVRLVLAGSQG